MEVCTAWAQALASAALFVTDAQCEMERQALMRSGRMDRQDYPPTTHPEIGLFGSFDPRDLVLAI